MLNVRNPVVCVQVDEIAQLAVHRPFQKAISVLELDAENGMRVVERVYRVGNAELEVVEEDRYLAVGGGELRDQDRKHVMYKNA